MLENRVPPRTVNLTARLAPGVGGALCSPAHAAAWKVLQVASGLPAEVSEREYAMVDGCSHCVVCGFLVAKPARCLVHGSQCPLYSLEQSQQLLMVVQVLYEAGLAFPMTDVQFATIWETSKMLHEARRWSGHEILDLVRDELLG